jgi:hypothetical protein
MNAKTANSEINKVLMRHFPLFNNCWLAYWIPDNNALAKGSSGNSIFSEGKTTVIAP